MYNIRNFVIASTSIPFLVLYAVAVTHFNNLMHCISSLGFEPSPSPINSMRKCQCQHPDQPLGTVTFEICAKVIFMKWLFIIVIMILLLFISQIKFLKLSIFSLFIGYFVSFLSFECSYIFIHFFHWVVCLFLVDLLEFYFSNSGHLSSVLCIANIPPIFSLLLISFPVFLDK